MRRSTLTVFTLISFAATAQDPLERSQRALQTIADFAKQMCADPDYSGTSSSVVANAKAKAEVSKLVRQLIAADVELKADAKRESFQGMLRSDLLQATRDAASCRLAIFNDLKDRLLPSKASNSIPIVKPRVPDKSPSTDSESTTSARVSRGDQHPRLQQRTPSDIGLNTKPSTRADPEQPKSDKGGTEKQSKGSNNSVSTAGVEGRPSAQQTPPSSAQKGSSSAIPTEQSETSGSAKPTQLQDPKDSKSTDWQTSTDRAVQKHQNRGRTSLFAEVYFDQGSAELSETARKYLDRLIENLRLIQIDEIKAFGRTSSNEPSSRKPSDDLSWRRVDAVRDYLVGRGIRLEVLQVEGEGNQLCVMDYQCRGSRDRRVELFLRGTGELPKLPQNFAPKTEMACPDSSSGRNLEFSQVSIAPSRYFRRAPGRRPNHQVNHYSADQVELVAIDYYLGVGSEDVSKAQFAEFVRDTGYQTGAEKQGERYTWSNPQVHYISQADSVRHINFQDAQSYLEWLNRICAPNASAKFKFRLPTESEWEYAYNLIGIRTRFGNWTLDCEDFYTQVSTDGSAWVKDENRPDCYRVIRYTSSGDIWKPTSREFGRANVTYWSTGFRVFRTISSTP